MKDIFDRHLEQLRISLLAVCYTVAINVCIENGTFFKFKRIVETLLKLARVLTFKVFLYKHHFSIDKRAKEVSECN